MPARDRITAPDGSVAKPGRSRPESFPSEPARPRPGFARAWAVPLLIGLGVTGFGAYRVLATGPRIAESAPSLPDGVPLHLSPSRSLRRPDLLSAPIRPVFHPAVTAAPAPNAAGPPLLQSPPRAPAGRSLISAPMPPSRTPLTGAIEPPREALPVAEAPPTAKEDPDRAALLAYLKRMGEIEARRKHVVTNLLPGLMAMSVLKGMVGRQAPVQEAGERAGPGFDPASLNLAGETMGDYRSRLRAVETEARSVRPPAPAAAFHQGYLSAVRSYAGVIDEICASMMRLDRSLGNRMGELQERADGPLASADGELGELFRRYGLPRTFSVGDGGDGSVMF